MLSDTDSRTAGKVSDGVGEMTSRSDDTSGVSRSSDATSDSPAVSGSSETPRRGRRNRRDRHKHTASKASAAPDIASEPTHSDLLQNAQSVVVQSVIQADSGLRNKSSGVGSLPATLNETSYRGSTVDSAKPSLVSVSRPPVTSVTGTRILLLELCSFATFLETWRCRGIL